MSKQENLLHYWKLSKLVQSEKAKLVFFDENEEAFYLDLPEGDEFENCKYTFCEEKGFSSEVAEEFQSESWKFFPNEFKIFAFDYCIANGSAYESIQDTMTANEIASLISFETLNDKMDEEGLMLSEAEDDVMLLLERKVKASGRFATEDDLYDATKKLLTDFRNWLDDNHPENIKAA